MFKSHVSATTLYACEKRHHHMQSMAFPRTIHTYLSDQSMRLGCCFANWDLERNAELVILLSWLVKTLGAKELGPLESRLPLPAASPLWIPFLPPHTDFKLMHLLLDHSGSACILRFLSPVMQKPYGATNPFLPGRSREGGPIKGA